MNHNKNSLFILAAEPSADLQGAHLVDALHSISPQLSISGITGPRLREKNVKSYGHMEDLEVMGFTDVVMALPRLYRIFKKIRSTILQLNPIAVVCIDYPEFNLRLEKSLRRHGYQGRLIHYICPTVWAWRKKRILTMTQNLDLLLTIFPFEKKCFQNSLLSVEYVGHPLVKKIAHHQLLENFFQHYHLDCSKKILALFPGSRFTEINSNFALQIQAAQLLEKKVPHLQIAISLSHPRYRSQLSSFGYPIIEPEHRYDLMKHSHLALATSGTVTLELALFEIPTVAHYAIKPFDLFLAQKIFRIILPHYVIVNILMEKTVFPELFGPNFTLESLITHTNLLWHDKEKRQQCKKDCCRIKEILGNTDASLEAARNIFRMLNY